MVAFWFFFRISSLISRVATRLIASHFLWPDPEWIFCDFWGEGLHLGFLHIFVQNFREKDCAWDFGAEFLQNFWGKRIMLGILVQNFCRIFRGKGLCLGFWRRIFAEFFGKKDYAWDFGAEFLQNSASVNRSVGALVLSEK